MKIYVITETSFEYNDEIYSHGESDGGEPVVAYSTKEAADKALTLAVSDWVDSNLRDGDYGLPMYGYSMEDVVDVYKFAKLTGIDTSTLKSQWENYDGSVLETLRKNRDAVVQSLRIKPYKVTEIDLNEAASARQS